MVRGQSKTNNELNKLIGNKTIINYIKSQTQIFIFFNFSSFKNSVTVYLQPWLGDKHIPPVTQVDKAVHSEQIYCMTKLFDKTRTFVHSSKEKNRLLKNVRAAIVNVESEKCVCSIYWLTK